MKRNPSQKRAIAHLSGPMMVLAGPGSGKTSVIVERTAHMIQEGKIPASSVLVVTFSRAAAVEMKERFLKFTSVQRTGVTFGTFHGVFLRDPQTGLWSEWRKYPVRRRKICDFKRTGGKLCCRTVPGRGFCGRYCQGDQCCKGWKNRSGALLFFLLPG